MEAQTRVTIDREFLLELIREKEELQRKHRGASWAYFKLLDRESDRIEQVHTSMNDYADEINLLDSMIAEVVGA